MNCFDKIAMSITVYTVSCNFVTHATCLLALMVYKYNELQVFGATKKLSCKVNCKTPFFFKSVLLILLAHEIKNHMFHKYSFCLTTFPSFLFVFQKVGVYFFHNIKMWFL